MKATELSIRYTVSVSITRPIRLYDSEDTIEGTTDYMASREAKRELEREVLRALQKIDGDCDAEVLEHSIIEN